MIQQSCAICEASDYTLVYKANFDPKSIDKSTFSARRIPDQVHYQIVRCNRCGLLYSTPILEHKKIEKLYKQSYVSYDEHVENLQKTYGYYLSQLEKYNVKKSKLLEIGCGSGFFLEEAKRQGFKEVYGVELGKKSVEKARPDIRKNITIDLFRVGLYPPNYFDVVCCFQTLDHIIDPNGLLKDIYTVLKKGGLVLFLNHDEGALSSKILKSKSPIIDIEHTYLFNKKTMKLFFEKHSYKVLNVVNTFNIHSLSYLLQLFPLPKTIKLSLISASKKIGIDNKSVKLYLGNIALIGRK